MIRRFYTAKTPSRLSTYLRGPADAGTWRLQVMVSIRPECRHCCVHQRCEPPTLSRELPDSLLWRQGGSCPNGSSRVHSRHPGSARSRYFAEILIPWRPFGSWPDSDFQQSHWASFERPERSLFVLPRRFTCSGALRPLLDPGQKARPRPGIGFLCENDWRDQPRVYPTACAVTPL